MMTSPSRLPTFACAAFALTGVACASLKAVAETRPLPGVYSADVVRVIDGDTIEVRVTIWLGQEIVTSVRLAGIDTPELRRSGCAGERMRGEAARDALIRLVAGRTVILTEVEPDKYFGRVVGRVLIDGRHDAGAALLSQGFARPYGGDGRDRWCAG